MYSNTPIRFGNMEINGFNHIGVEYVIQNLMIHSLSPSARRSTEKLYTDNPYKINIKLGAECRNRAAEIVNTYLKTVGRRLVFKKIPKRKVKFTVEPVYFTKDPYIRPIFFGSTPEEVEEIYRLKEEKRNAKVNKK